MGAAYPTSNLDHAPVSFLLLGEVHDNPDGHARRFQYIQNLVIQGWRPTIAMEQFDLEQAADLALAQKYCVKADCVIGMAGGSSRWDWDLYRPILSLALEYRLKIVPANLSRSQANIVVRSGIHSVFDANIIRQYGLPLPPGSELMEYQMIEVDKGHCGLVPKTLLSGLANAQIARDIAMANSMLEQNQSGRDVILLAGNGHVRNDFGVPYWLRVQSPNSSIKTVGYLERTHGDEPSQFDIVEQVPPFQRPDPCSQKMPSMQSIK
ncbi:ChaN family lipoprotein [Polynucleobacter sp.]|jgi:uncharacterized iron-regulated protein|uniref:ChaN family lipoprotein n=1 Tax=Polynucleobacter sp. TaxID=2029855 RepID=UPI0037CB29E8